MPVAKGIEDNSYGGKRESINLSHLEGVQEPKSQLSPRMKLAVRRKSLSGKLQSMQFRQAVGPVNKSGGGGGASKFSTLPMKNSEPIDDRVPLPVLWAQI